MRVCVCADHCSPLAQQPSSFASMTAAISWWCPGCYPCPAFISSSRSSQRGAVKIRRFMQLVSSTPPGQTAEALRVLHDEAPSHLATSSPVSSILPHSAPATQRSAIPGTIPDPKAFGEQENTCCSSFIRLHCDLRLLEGLSHRFPALTMFREAIIFPCPQGTHTPLP